MSSFFRFLSRGRVVLLLMAAYLANQISIGIVLGDVRDVLLALQLSFTVERFQHIMSSFTPAMHEQFTNHFYLDFYHPFLYSMFLAAALGWGLKKQGYSLPTAGQKGRLRWFLLLPFAAGACDLLENSLHLLMHLQLLAESAPAVFLSSLAAAVKWSLALFCTLSAAYLIFKPSSGAAATG